MIKCANINNGLRVTTDGKFTPCCIASETYLKDDDGNVMSVLNTTFQDALQSPTLKKLKEDFKNGIKSPECNGCWNLEDSGVESKRIRDNNRVAHLTLLESEIHFLELNMGNICNLTCRICNVYSSSNWKKEHKSVLNPDISDEKLNQITKSCSLPFADDSMVWDEIEKNISSVKILDLYGGEPMLMKKQWSILEKCVYTGIAKNKYVHFNTNGTIFKDEYFEILKNFELSDISFSIDGVGDKFNYLRYGANWNEVKNNILLWLDKTKDLKNFKFHICYTVSIMNVLDFNEVAEFAIENNIRIHCNFLSQPKYYCINNIPENLKIDIEKYVNESYNSLPVKSPEIKEQFTNITQYLNSKESTEQDWNSFIKINNLLDESRDQKFKDIFPITYNILKLS
jgi:molybdenum cofactor biosynthesis enzyme MoaA